MTFATVVVPELRLSARWLATTPTSTGVLRIVDKSALPLLARNADPTVPKFIAPSPQNHLRPKLVGAARHRCALFDDGDASSTPDNQRRTDRPGSVKRPVPMRTGRAACDVCGDVHAVIMRDVRTAWEARDGVG